MKIQQPKNEYKLLPHIKESVYGLNPQAVQILGWEIIKFQINNLWSISTGKGVTVGVIDTGCDINHIDLRDNIVEGKNFINPKQDPIDHNGHGTHVSGTIGATNNKLGMVGIAPDTKIMPLKALNDEGSGTENSIANAILYGSKHCDFLCMSLGSPKNSSRIHSAIKEAEKRGCIIFCAAGNAGYDRPILYPAKLAETIAVGAIDEQLNRTSFTCTGKELDFLTPGHNIFSCIPLNNYALMSGTSMATPFLVGYCSLLKSINRQISKASMITILKNSCKPLLDKTLQNKIHQGYGIVCPSVENLKSCRLAK